LRGKKKAESKKRKAERRKQKAKNKKRKAKSESRRLKVKQMPKTGQQTKIKLFAFCFNLSDLF